MSTYQIFAYDKDSDRLDLLTEISRCDLTNTSVLNTLLRDFAKLVHTEQLKALDGQPYDWIELHSNGKRIAFE